MKNLSADFIKCITYTCARKISGKLPDMKIVKRGRWQKHRRQVWPETSRTNGFKAVTVLGLSTRFHFDQGLSLPPPSPCQTSKHMNRAGDAWLPIVPVRHEQPAELRYDVSEMDFETI